MVWLGVADFDLPFWAYNVPLLESFMTSTALSCSLHPQLRAVHFILVLSSLSLQFQLWHPLVLVSFVSSFYYWVSFGAYPHPLVISIILVSELIFSSSWSPIGDLTWSCRPQSLSLGVQCPHFEVCSFHYSLVLFIASTSQSDSFYLSYKFVIDSLSFVVSSGFSFICVVLLLLSFIWGIPPSLSHFDFPC